MFKANFIKGAHRFIRNHMPRVGFEYTESHSSHGHRIGVWTKKIKGATASTDQKLVVVPGFGDTPLSWISVIAPYEKSLGNQFSEWVILDFPGYSGFLGEEPAVESIGELLEATHETLLGIKGSTILGHSLGGWSTIHHAVRNAEAQNGLNPKLILINPSGVLLREEDEKLWQGIFDDALARGFEAYVHHYIHKKPLWLPLLKSVLDEFFQRKEIQNFIRSVEKKDFLNERISRITAPVELIWSEFDRLNPVHWLEDWKGFIPHANITMLKSVGHSPQLERPLQTLATLASVLLNKPTLMSKNPLKRWLWVNRTA